jgi:hypothetical protein
MTCKLLFQQFEPAIRERFRRALEDAGDGARDIQLQMHEESQHPGFRSEFAADPEDLAVRVTWNGIASLWASCQGFARIARLMQEGILQGNKQIQSQPNTEAGIGLLLLTTSMWFNTNDLPADGKRHWVHGVPAPSAQPRDQDSINGYYLFLGSLGWILRHEIAHITLCHVFTIPSEAIVQERQADDQAADWLRGDRTTDEARPAGGAPTGQEIELEQRALAIVLGAVWIASFEIRGRQPSPVHPPISDRIYNTLDRMQLREDSAALGAAANCIQALIDPQGEWATPDKPFQNSLEFLQEAVRRLQHYMLALRHQEPWHAPSPDSGHRPGS